MSATWDSKAVKATPILADEILLIDTEDGRNQKRATLASFGAAVWTRNAGQGFIFPNVITDRVGIGFSGPPDSTLHVRTIIAGAGVPSQDADDFILENNGNTGYTTPPTVTIAAPPTPITALATAVLDTGIGSVTTGLPSGTGYTQGEIVTLTGVTSSANDARGTVTLTGLIDSVAVVASGSGYLEGESIGLTGVTSGSTDATATVTVIGGLILTITIVSGGTGYVEGETLTVTGGTGSGGTGTATILGQIASIAITVTGSGYSTDEDLTIVGGTSGASNATATSTTTQFVTSITVDTIGSGYATTPNVVISGGGGSGATATTVLVNTEVTVITVTATGSGFTSVPTVTVDAAPSPVTATATANLTGDKVTSTTITEGGVGYKIPPPTITITGGDGTGAGVDEIVLANSSITSITITAGGTGMTIFNAAGQVGVIDFEHSGGPTQHGRIMYDHGTQTMRFLNTSVQGLLIDDEGHVAVTPDNVNHPENFTIDSDEINHPTRMLIADSADRLLIGYNGIEPFNFSTTPAQIIVLGNTGDLVLATRGNFASKMQFYTSAGTNLGLAMTITSDRNVGVNTSDPQEKIYVVAGKIGGANSEAQAGRWSLGSVSSSVELKTLFPTPLHLGANDAIRMAITSAGNIGMGTSNPDTTAVLDLTSTTQGFLHPRMTTTQRDAIASPAEALIISNTTKRTLDCFSTPDWRPFSTQGVFITEVWALADFPTPSGGVITITNATKIFQKPITISDRFVMADTQNVTFRSSDRSNNVVTYDGNDTLFTAPNNTTFNLFDMDSLLTGSNAKFLDFTKGNSNIERITVTWTGTGGVIGNITNTFLPLLDDMVYIGFETGIVARDFANFQFRNVGLFPSQASTGPFVTMSGRAEFAGTIGRGGYNTGINNSCFFISPDLVGLVVMEDVVNQGVGQFYQTAPTGTFSAASDEAATNAISSVSDNGGTAVFDKGSGLTNILDNDIVVHTTFSDGTYNGTFEIFATQTSTYQVRDAVTKVAVTFNATGTGTGTTELTRFTATAHGLSSNDPVLPTSTDYNTGERIRGTPLTNSFDLRVPFVSTNTGTWQVDLGTFTVASDENFAKTITAVALAPADGSTPAGIRLTVSGGASPMLDRDVVVNTGFTDPAYNGTFVVSNVQSGTFDLVSRAKPIIFTATDTGTSTDQVTRFTSINHGLVNLEGVQLKSNSYNLGAGIRGTPATSTFDLPITFVADEVGTTNVNSLDQSDPRMTVRDCTGSPDSVVEAEFSFINIATPETVTISTEAVPVAIAGGAWTASKLERILEPSGGNGIAVYNGIEDIEIPIGFFCLLEKVGGGATDIGCTILVNGIDVIANHPHSVNAGIIQISGTAILSLKTGDTVQMAVLNDSGTANIDVSQANMVLSIS